MISCTISCSICVISDNNQISICCCSPAGAEIPPAPRADAIDDCEREPDTVMDSDEERDFADQGLMTDMNMQEDDRILATFEGHSHLYERS